jgi:sugar transferase (PEP-CTERM system associated)
LARPRFIAYFALEGSLIFAVLYGLATLTLPLIREPDLTGMPLTVLVTGGLFATLLLLTQWSNLGDKETVRREIILFSINSIAWGVAAFIGLLILFQGNMRLSVLLPLEGAVAVPATVALWRWITIRFQVFSATRERVLIVGTAEIAQQVCRWISNHHAGEYSVVGFADESDERIGTVLAMGARIQTDYRSLPRFAPQRADRIIVALDEKRGKLPVKQLMELRLRGLEIEEATTFFERISGKIAVEAMLPSWLIFSDGFKTSPTKQALKRIADIFHSVVLLVITSPLMALTSIAICFDGGRPVLYRQSRVGLNGREFNLYKFRSMRHDAEAKCGPTWATQDDPRVTRVGKIIRKLRIDELPQLLNVLRGEMSFVGPRPERGHFVRQLESSIPYYGLRMTVRPGVTGWAQVEYRYSSSEEDSQEKLKYDLYYIKNNNLLFDLWIALKTVKVVLLGSGAR